jgi:hypothetical protein
LISTAPNQGQPKDDPLTKTATMYALLATTLTLLLTVTSANPLTKRNIGGIRLCDQTNWAGNCWYGVVPLNECIALNSLYVVSISLINKINVCRKAPLASYYR